MGSLYDLNDLLKLLTIIAMTVVVVVVVAVICIQQTDNVMYSWCLLEAVSYIISKIDCNVMILEAVASLMDLPVE